MFHFEFTPEKADQPANLALIADTQEELDGEMFDCVRVAIEAHEEGRLKATEVRELMGANPEDLPVKTLAKILGGDGAINTHTGLIAYPDEEKSSFKDFTSEISEYERSQMAFKEDDIGVLKLVFEGICNANAWPVQILQKADDTHEMIEHTSYGKLYPQGDYTPILTVLSDEHPVMQYQLGNEASSSSLGDNSAT